MHQSSSLIFCAQIQRSQNSNSAPCASIIHLLHIGILRAPGNKRKRKMASQPVHPNAVVLPPPFRVSPFIRFCRFAALGAGITYGWLRFSYLKRKHGKVREREHEKEVVTDYHDYRKREIQNKDNVLAFLKEAGLPTDETMAKSFGVKEVV